MKIQININGTDNKYTANFREIYKLRPDNMEKVIDFFCENDCGTAAEIGVSGQFMHVLCKRGIASMDGEKTYTYNTVDLCPRTKKTSCYKLDVNINDLINTYALSCVDYLQDKLEKKKNMIDNLEEDVKRLELALNNYVL